MIAIGSILILGKVGLIYKSIGYIPVSLNANQQNPSKMEVSLSASGREFYYPL